MLKINLKNALKKQRQWKQVCRTPVFRKALNLCLQDSKRHLDFGSGFGSLAWLVAQKYKKTEVIGIDKDRRLVKFASKRYHLPNLKFAIADKPSGKYGSIDVCLVLHDLEGIERGCARKMLSLLNKCLNKEGRILVYEYKRVSRKDWMKYRKRVCGNFDLDYKFHNKRTAKDYARMCARAGFKTKFIGNVDKYRFVLVGEKI